MSERELRCALYFVQSSSKYYAFEAETPVRAKYSALRVRRAQSTDFEWCLPALALFSLGDENRLRSISDFDVRRETEFYSK